jgi:hypothetical protein
MEETFLPHLTISTTNTPVILRTTAGRPYSENDLLRAKRNHAVPYTDDFIYILTDQTAADP